MYTPLPLSVTCGKDTQYSPHPKSNTQNRSTSNAGLGAIGSLNKCFPTLEQDHLFGAGRTRVGPCGDMRVRVLGKKADAGMQISDG